MKTNHCFLRALQRQPVDYTPVWMMRQAGRYLPEYRATRQRAGSFLDLCQNPELACEVTMQPLERFKLDAAILFSDILTIPDAMGLGPYFTEGEGPKFQNPVRTPEAIKALPIPDPEIELRYVMDAVRLIRKDLQDRVPLIGFSGSPWTLATYMVEGSGSKAFCQVKSLMWREPKAFHQLLEKITQTVILYLNAQIQAGAQAVMIFDTWGGLLTPSGFNEFSLAYLQKIVSGLTRQQDGEVIPVVLFTKGGGHWLNQLADTGCDALGLDWTTDIHIARQQVGDRVALQGNMDPCMLYAEPQRIEAEVADILARFGQGSGHVFNLGHGIHPDIPPEHVGAFIDAVHKISPTYHR